MFNKKSNTMFNNAMFKRAIILLMKPNQKLHESSERLYEAAKKLKSLEGIASIAELLNQSFQTVKNWESRGVSLEGALLAQEKIGCNALWLLGRGNEMSFFSPVEMKLVADFQASAHEDKETLLQIATAFKLKAGFSSIKTG